jgi:probable HAF family extracellular repeat protein
MTGLVRTITNSGHRKAVKHRVAIVATLLTSSLACAAPSTRYVVTGATPIDLGTLGGAQSKALDINNGGYIVGWATTPDEDRHAFYYIGAASYMYDIGATSGIGASEAHGINNSNRVVGHSFNTLGLSHAFFWYAGGHVMLADEDVDPSLGRVYSTAVAISDGGHIVGQRIFLDLGVREATLWSDYLTFHSLYRAKYSLSSFAHDVNVYAQAVGRERYSDNVHRWNWSPAGITDNLVPGVANSDDALGINAAGAVVGFKHVCCASPGNIVQHAFLWDGVSPSSFDLGVLPDGTNSVAEDINNAHFIAGYGDRTLWWRFYPVTSDSAFIYHTHFGMYELPKLPGAVPYGNCRAHALNERQANSGLVQVVGYCEVAGGGPRAVRWDVTVKTVSILPPRPTP